MIGNFFVLVATALSLLVVDLVVPGVDIATFPAALLAAVAIGLVNSFVKPTLATLTLPLNAITLGTFSFLVNGLCLWLASVFVPGFNVHGLLAILLGPVILSLVNTFLNQYLTERGFDLKTNITTDTKI
jgi:putative membrane protein